MLNSSLVIQEGPESMARLIFSFLIKAPRVTSASGARMSHTFIAD